MIVQLSMQGGIGRIMLAYSKQKSTFIKMIIQITMMKFILNLLLIVAIIKANPCYSTCLTCSGYGSWNCTSCPTPLALATDNRCIASGKTVSVETADSNWQNSSDGYISFLYFANVPHSSSASLGWNSTNLAIYPGDSASLILIINSIPAYLSMKIRASMEQDLSGCTQSEVEILTPDGNVSNFKLTVSSLTYEHTVSTGLNSTTIQIKGLSAGDCPFFQLKSATLIIELCETGCSTCSGSSSNCSACISGYFLLSYTSCVTTCPDYTYANSGNQMCRSCFQICLTCSDSTASGCTSCGVDSFGVQNYFNGVTLSCSPTCSNSYLNDIFGIRTARYECNICATGCTRCSAANDINNCTQCNNALLYYFSSTSSTTCVLCTSGYTAIGNPLTCTPCDSTCGTCENLATFCLTCPGGSGLYLYNNTCLAQCPTGFFGDAGECFACNSNCLTCFNPSEIGCSSCGLTSPGSERMYLDAVAGTCSTTCATSYLSDTSGSTSPPHQCNLCDIACVRCAAPNLNSACTECNNNGSYYFSSASNITCVPCSSNQIALGTPLTCTPCDASCLTCQNSTTSCLSCSGTFLLNFTCVSSCPIGYYGSSSVCNICDSSCLSCSGPASNQCISCPVIDNNGIPTIYYLTTNNTCQTSCPNGTVPTTTSPYICQGCPNGCQTCSTTNTSICLVCQSGFYAYNSLCYSTCPNNTFTFGSECLLQCPNGYTGSIGSVSTCIVCSTNCVNYGFTVATKVANGGNNFQHRVNLPQGISPNVTSASLQQGLTVELTTTGNRRLLLSTVSLSVQSVSISSSGTFLTVLTNYYAANLLTSSISVNFQAGTLLTASGNSYTQLTGTVSLSSPDFLNSYYEVFGVNKSLIVEGICYVLLSFILFIGSLVIRNRKLTAQCLSFVSMVQLYGLARVRDAPYDFQHFGVLQGYAYYQLLFIPNRFADPFFQNNYSQVAVDSAVFTFGTQNFIINFGSLFYFILGFELLLLIYLCYLKYKEGKKVKFESQSASVNQNKQNQEEDSPYNSFWFLQYSFIYFWATILLFGSSLCLLSLLNNTISSNNLQYAFSILTSFLVITFYFLYYSFRVVKEIKTDLFQLNDVLRICGLLLLALNYNFGILLINFSEVFFFAVDATYYRQQKINFPLYTLERIAFLIAFNAALFKVTYVPLLITAGICFFTITSIKGYYFGRAIYILFHPSQQVENALRKIDESISESKLGSQNPSVNEQLVKQKQLNHRLGNRIESNISLNNQSEINPGLILPELIGEEESVSQVKKTTRKKRKNQDPPQPEPILSSAYQNSNKIFLADRNQKSSAPEPNFEIEIEDISESQTNQLPNIDFSVTQKN